MSDYIIENGELKKYTGSGGDVIVPSGVISIGNDAFSFCDGITSVTLPEGVTSIGQFAFSHCHELTSVNLPDSLIRIDGCAFTGCHNLCNIYFSKEKVSIGYNPFLGCYGLADENGFIIIHNSLFGYCGEMNSVTIPDGVTDIREEAFAKNNKIIEVTLPASVIEIGFSAFSNCSSIESVNLNEGLLRINQEAFKSCSKLKNIIIPSSVISIEDSAFEGCHELSNIIFPKGITRVAPYTFCNCYDLNSIVLPDSVTSIGVMAFNGCNSLTRIVIPEQVSFIADDSFSESLEEIILCGNKVKITGSLFKHYPLLHSIVAPSIPISEFISNKLGIKAAQGFVNHKEKYLDRLITESYIKYINRQKPQLQPSITNTALSTEKIVDKTLLPDDKKDTSINNMQDFETKLVRFKRLYVAACSDGEAHINYPFVTDYSIDDYRRGNSSDFENARTALSQIDEFTEAILTCWDNSVKQSSPISFSLHELHESHYKVAFAIAIAIKVFICDDVSIVFGFSTSKWTSEIDCHWVLSPSEPEGRVYF